LGLPAQPETPGYGIELDDGKVEARELKKWG